MPNTKTDHEAIQNEAVSATEGAAPTPSLVSKKAGNKNALFHGIYSDEIILPWESPVDFEKLHSSFKDEWHPLACTRFRRHQVRCFNGTGGASWSVGNLRGNSSLRLCG